MSPWLKSGLDVDRQKYLDQYKLLKDLIYSTKMKYCSSLIDEAGDDQNSLFRLIDRVLHRKPSIVYPTAASSVELARNFAESFNDKITVIF